MDENGTSSALQAALLSSLLREYRDGRDPLVDYDLAHTCLVATGLPLARGAVSDLLVETIVLNNRSVGKLGDFVEAADAYIARRIGGPNLKTDAAARARAAKRDPKPSAAVGVPKRQPPRRVRREVGGASTPATP